MRRKLVILTSAFTFIIISLLGQNGKVVRHENYDLQKFRIIKIKVRQPQEHLSLHNINSVIVIDARPDTISIGFMQKHPTNHAFVQLNKSVKQETEDFVNDYLQLNKTNSSGTLIMVLKKMWLTDELNLSKTDYLNEKIWAEKKEYTSGIKMKAEFYYKKENDYYPLYRYDSVLTDSFTVSENGPYFIHDAIIASLSKLSTIDSKLSDLSNKRKLTWIDIKQHDDDDFNMPALKDSNLQRGVYMTFEEFKKNQPSEKNFEVTGDKMNDILYITQPDGNELAARNIWGYCDGEKTFIRSGENFFELQRRGNAFYIYGAKKLTKKLTTYYDPPPGFSTSPTGIPSTGAYPEVPNTSYSQPTLKLEPLQLDWDTGKLD